MIEKKLNPKRIKRYVRALSIAIKKHELRNSAKHQIREHIEEIKQLVSDQTSSKSQISDVVAKLESKISQVVKDEVALLEDQKIETKIISELKSKIEDLQKKVNAVESDAKINSSTNEQFRLERLKRLQDIELKIKQKQDEEAKAKEIGNAEAIKEIESQLALLEQKHDELVKSGEHPEHHLSRLRTMIDSHKAALNALKADSSNNPIPTQPTTALVTTSQPSTNLPAELKSVEQPKILFPALVLKKKSMTKKNKTKTSLRSNQSKSNKRLKKK